MKRYVFVFVLVLVLLAVPSTVHAAPLAQDVAPVSQLDFGALVDSLKSLVGISALIAAIVNIGKSAGWVKDGQAGTWSAILNLVALVGLCAAQLSGYANMIPWIDSQAGGLAAVASTVFMFVAQVWLSRQVHASVFAGLPVIGTSNSARQAGDVNVATVEIS